MNNVEIRCVLAVSSHATFTTGENTKGNNSVDQIRSSESFLVPKRVSTCHITVADQVSQYECSFVAPTAVYDGMHRKSVSFSRMRAYFWAIHGGVNAYSEFLLLGALS